MKVLPECYTKTCKPSMLCNCPGSVARLVLLGQVELVELIELVELLQPVLVAPIGPIAPVAQVGLLLPLVALIVLLPLLPLLVPSLQLHLVLPLSLSRERIIKDDKLF